MTLRLLGIEAAVTVNPGSASQSVLIGRQLAESDILERLLHSGRVLDWEDELGNLIWGRIIQPPQRWDTSGELFIRVMHHPTEIPSPVRSDDGYSGPDAT